MKVYSSTLKKIDTKSWAITTGLILLAMALGATNITFFGIKLHIFQLAVFVCAIGFGALFGGIVGAFGSLVPAVLTGNPFIVLFNGLLGYFFGKFFEGKPLLALVKSLIIVFPTVFVVDYFVVGMPLPKLLILLASLGVMNVFWAVLAKNICKYFGLLNHG